MVANTPAAIAGTVAEHAVALLLSAARQIPATTAAGRRAIRTPLSGVRVFRAESR